MRKRNNLKKMINNNELVLGLTVSIPNPAVAEIAGLCGCDFIRVDAQHGLFDLETIGNFVRAADSVGISVIVRVPDMSIIYPLLDFGVAGIIVPEMGSVSQAKEAVKIIKYHPVGKRGISHGRSQHYGLKPIQEYIEETHNETLLIIQIETKEGFENMNDIVKVPGIDLIDTGPSDISQALGIPGETSNNQVIELEEEILKIGRKSGLGTFLPTGGNDVKELIKKGGRIFTITTDLTILTEGVKKTVKEVREYEQFIEESHQ